MNHVGALVLVGAGLYVTGAIEAVADVSPKPAILVTGQSSQSKESRKEQARKSQETLAHSQFGGAAKDQETRERHHPQYPESAQHLGPQEEQSSKGTSGGKAKSDHEEKAQDAVSGVGR